MEIEIEQQNPESPNQENSEQSIVDDDLVSFFDLLARFDFEDKQKEMSALRPDSPSSSPGDQVLAQR